MKHAIFIEAARNDRPTERSVAHVRLCRLAGGTGGDFRPLIKWLRDHFGRAYLKRGGRRAFAHNSCLLAKGPNNSRKCPTSQSSRSWHLPNSSMLIISDGLGQTKGDEAANSAILSMASIACGE
jgi:hypothetical protein